MSVHTCLRHINSVCMLWVRISSANFHQVTRIQGLGRQGLSRSVQPPTKIIVKEERHILGAEAARVMLGRQTMICPHTEQKENETEILQACCPLKSPLVLRINHKYYQWLRHPAYNTLNPDNRSETRSSGGPSDVCTKCLQTLNPRMC
jgi:hypothetical protein